MKNIICILSVLFCFVLIKCEALNIRLIKKELINSTYSDFLEHNNSEIEQRKERNDKRLVLLEIIDAIPMGDDVLIKFEFRVYDENDKLIKTF